MSMSLTATVNTGIWRRSNDANERRNGRHAIASRHGKLDAIDAWTVRSRATPACYTASASLTISWNVRSATFPAAGGCALIWRGALICRSDLLLLERAGNTLDLDAVIWLEMAEEAIRAP